MTAVRRPEPGEVVGLGYGIRMSTMDGGSYWNHVRPDRRGFALFHPDVEPVELECVADPEGDYKGWLEDGRLSMILREPIFEIQFPYGSEAQEGQGRGVAVRLSIRPAAGSPDA